MMSASAFIVFLLMTRSSADNIWGFGCDAHTEIDYATTQMSYYMVNMFKYTDLEYGCYLFGSFSTSDPCHEDVHKLEKNGTSWIEAYPSLAHCCHFDGVENFFKKYPVNCTKSNDFQFFALKYFNNSYAAMLQEMFLDWIEFYNSSITTTVSTLSVSTTEEFDEELDAITAADNNGIGATMVLALPIALLLVLIVVFRR